MGSLNEHANGPADGHVTLVKQIGQLSRVPIHAKGKLGEVVRADGKPVETSGEFFGQQYVGRYLGHDVNLQSVPSTLQPVYGHFFEHPIRFLQGAAKRYHDNDVLKTHRIPHLAYGFALQCEASPVPFTVVAGSPAPSEHGVVLGRFKGVTTDQSGIFVRLEVAHADNDRLRSLRRGNGGDTLREEVHEITGRRIPALG